MNKSEYDHFMNENKATLNREYASEVTKFVNYYTGRWKQLTQSSTDKHSLIARLPIKFFVVCCHSKTIRSQIQENILTNNILVFGDLFNKQEIDFKKSIISYAGYNTDNVALAQYNWPYFLKDLVAESPYINILFTIGSEATRYLDVLKYAENINIILIDELNYYFNNPEEEHTCISKDQVSTIFNYQEEIKEQMNERNCQFNVVKYDHSSKIYSDISNLIKD